MRLYREPDILPLFQINFSNGIITNPPFTFWNNNNELRILVSHSLNNKAYLCVYSGTGDSLGRFEIARGIDRNDNGFWDGKITPVAIKDLNNDGALDVLLIIFTAHDLHPRGVCAFDLKNKKKLWEFMTGAYINDAIIADLTGDGKPEIILGSATVDNGSIANGTDDKHSYLIILDKDGKQKVKKDWDEFSACQIQTLDIDGDDKQELVSVLSYSKLENYNQAKITLWEGSAHKPRKEIVEHFYGPKIESKDVNKDGKDEIIVSSVLDARIIVFNENLEYIFDKRIKIDPINLLVEDINTDGTFEIIVSGKKGTIVYDDKLKPLAHTNFGGTLKIVNNGHKNLKYLVIANNGFILKPNITYYKIRVGWLLLGLILGAIVFFIIVFGYFRALPSYRYLRLFKDTLSNFQCPAILFDKNGKMLIATENVKQYADQKSWNLKSRYYPSFFNAELSKIMTRMISSILKSDIHDTSSKNKKLVLSDGRSIHIAVHPIKIKNDKLYGILVCLHDISKLKESEQAMAWAAMSQKLTHEIKNPLHTVLLTLQRLQMVYEEDKVKNLKIYNKYTNSVIEEVERLRKITDGFMKFTKQKPSEFEVMSTEKLVKSVEERVREWLPGKVALEVETEKEMPDIRVDVDQMQRLFFNVFDNAVKAMNGKGRLALRVTTAQWINSNGNNENNEVILFEVSDTGCGIAEDKLSQLFDPYISLRDGGTGLGLTICKKIVEDHNGKISIHSKEGVGTTVKIEIPVCIEKLK